MRERWLSGRALSLHLAVLVFVPGCAIAAWWQINRAEGGNQLSYLYSVMWPAFGILGIYFWWMLIHTDFETVGLKGMRRQQEAEGGAVGPDAATAAAPGPDVKIPIAPHRATAEEEDPELAAYNARLAASGRPGPQDLADPRVRGGQAGPMRRLTQRGLRGALFRYQLMANIVGVLIIPLFLFTGLHLAIGGFKIELAIFGVGHGYLYIVYLITAGFLALKARLHIPWILLMFAAGLVPGLTFLVEWIIVTKKIQPILAVQEASAGADSGVSPVAQ